MIALLATLTLGTQAPIWLPSFFSDNMVLQREKPIPVWGRAKAGSTVEIRLAGRKTTAKAGPDGKFLAKLRAMPAGGPYKLELTDGKGAVTIDNVLVGEVWICSGQSNMEMNVASSYWYDQEQAEAQPMVRTFTAARVSVDKPAADSIGEWVAAAPNTVGGFTAAGYAFGKELYNRLKVPIGLIHTSWGGTPAESWTSGEMLLAHKETAYLMERYVSNSADYEKKLAEYHASIMPWHRKAYPQQYDNRGFAQGWAGTDPGDWAQMPVPGTVEDALGTQWDGAIWLKTTVDVPAGMAGKDVNLDLGAIDDTDDTYFNGELVGATGVDTIDNWATPRKYKVPGRLVREGKNLIAVRVFDTAGAGGITGPANLMKLGDIPLAGSWAYRIEQDLVPPPAEVLGTQPVRPFGPGDPWVPSGLYNGMLAPFIPYAIRGAIWYQGESNADRAYQYRTLFPAMIDDWRKRWGQGDFPFYFVQLANYMARNDQPVDSAWAELREAQTMTLKRPNTGMAVAIDIGDAVDIHPKNKREVGRRLALWALAKIHGMDIPFSGPLYKGMKVEGSKIRLAFTSTDGGLGTQDGKAVRGFAVAGKDKKFVWANAVIDGNAVVVSHPTITDPVAVRYGWSDNPDVNLCNAAGLPASPFRTDKWRGRTFGAR